MTCPDHTVAVFGCDRCPPPSFTVENVDWSPDYKAPTTLPGGYGPTYGPTHGLEERLEKLEAKYWDMRLGLLKRGDGHHDRIRDIDERLPAIEARLEQLLTRQETDRSVLDGRIEILAAMMRCQFTDLERAVAALQAKASAKAASRRTGTRTRPRPAPSRKTSSDTATGARKPKRRPR